MIAIRAVTASHRLQTVRHSSRSRKINSAIPVVRHNGHFKLLIHPDANHDPNVKWLDTLTEKAMIAAGVGNSVDLNATVESHREAASSPGCLYIATDIYGYPKEAIKR